MQQTYHAVTNPVACQVVQKGTCPDDRAAMLAVWQLEEAQVVQHRTRTTRSTVQQATLLTVQQATPLFGVVVQEAILLV